MPGVGVRRLAELLHGGEEPAVGRDGERRDRDTPLRDGDGAEPGGIEHGARPCAAPTHLQAQGERERRADESGRDVRAGPQAIIAVNGVTVGR